jgi:hypothetical protein
MAAVVEHAYEEEERSGREAVVDHLEERAFPRHLVDRQEPQHHEAEVGDGGVGHELLHVVLHPGDQSSVEDADEREPHQERLRHLRGFGEERQGEAQESVGAKLEQDAR